jgi:futalosine hydrolase
MHLLVVAATESELASLVTSPLAGGHRADTLITGVGMVATAVQVSRALAHTPYDLALNVGICGAFDRFLPLGTVVHVTSDRLAELGVEDADVFLPADDVGLVAADDMVFNSGHHGAPELRASATFTGLPHVSGITVNTVHGNDASIAMVANRWHPQVESMEGAAFMAACRAAGVPYAQIRGVSNYVERRNRAAWKMAEAIEALGRTTTAILNEL